VSDIPADLDWIRAAPEDETGPGPWLEVASGPDELIYIRETSDPENVVTTTQRKWDAFVLGVLAGEFDHFAELPEPEPKEGQPQGRPGRGG
jgi:hypothetical protein